MSREFAYLMAALEERRLLTMEKILLEMLPEKMTASQRTSEVQRSLHFVSMLTKVFSLFKPSTTMCLGAPRIKGQKLLCSTDRWQIVGE